MTPVLPQQPIRKRNIYPESDGQPIADNTLQFDWIQKVTGGIRTMYKRRTDVFVAGDLLWYPVEGEPTIRAAPDAMVAFGRPPGYRGSYLQWLEDNIPPQVVFEILSPNNRPTEMLRKLGFYNTHGVEEYYVYDPDRIKLEGYIRRGGQLEQISPMNGWRSPRLGIRFNMDGEELVIETPDGSPFLTYVEFDDKNELAFQRLDEERAARIRAEKLGDLAIDQAAKSQAEAAKSQAEAAKSQAEVTRVIAEKARLAEKLRSLGIDPDAV